MTNFEHIMDETHDTFNAHITNHPIVQHVVSGKMTVGEYLSYLTETFHMVCHTPRMLALAAARLNESRRALRDWFIEQAGEEANHDLFCIKDVTNLGFNPDEVFARKPMSGSWGLVTQNYFMATYGRPESILGVASLTEGLGASLAGSIADTLNTDYRLPPNVTTFLKSHSGFDAKHLEDCKCAINNLVSTNEEIEAIIHGRRMTIIYYAQMFTDILAHPVQTEKYSSVA